jgi:tetratricopeptide (TPR) repeat protein
MSESAKRSLVIFTYVVLILSTLLVFWQVCNFDFINYDDGRYVAENPHVLNGLSRDGIIWAFTTGHASNWHPLTWLSHMLDCHLFGPRPGWMHLVNVLLHLANTLLLFAVLKKMTGSLWPSAFVAAAFALHPMHVESVAWIAERKDVLSAFFLLLTLAAYVGYVKRPSVFRYLITLVLFVIGLLAKPMLVTLPLLLLLLDYWPLNRFDPQPVKTSGRQPIKPALIHDGRAILYGRIIEKVPFLAIAAISSVITFLVQRAGGAMVDINALSLKDRVANAFLSYAKYIGKMFWPQDLAVFYPLGDNIAFWQVAMSVLLLLVISILVIRFRRERKYLSAGWFWFLGTLIPVIGLVKVGDQAYADRYTYVPYIGLFIMIAWGLPELLSKLPYRKMTLGISGMIALTALGICAHQQVSYWNNSIALFSHAIEVTQNNYIAYSNRGSAYVVLGRGTEAMDDYKQAIRIKPHYAEAYYNLGVAYGCPGRWQDAIDAHKQAIKIDPDYAEAYNNLGVAYGGLGGWQDAIDAYKQAIKIKPDYAEAYNNLGVACRSLGHGTEAIDAYKEAIRIKPDYARAYNNLALLIATDPEIKNRDTNEAIRLASRACELANYKDPSFLDTLAAAYASAARFSEAVDTANRAMDLADAANQPQIKNVIRYHLSFYTQGKPYIEPVPKLLPKEN